MYYFVDPEISHEKIKLRHLSTQKLSVRNRIVDIHNHFRASVKPPAKNMLKLVSRIFSIYFLIHPCLKLFQKRLHIRNTHFISALG